MQCLEPQRVCNKDIISWFKQSFELINRRILANFLAVALFFTILFFSTQALTVSDQFASPVFMLFGFLIFTAFVFYLSLAGLVLISHSSDHSHVINLSHIIQTFMPSQKIILKLSVIGIGVGIFFWYTSMLMNPGTSIITSSENLINKFSSDQLALFYIMKTGAVFLFFVLLAMLSLRSFFSLPLILFHGLGYEEAQKLSHKGIIKNIKVMSNVLILWSVAILLIIKVAPVLILFLLPLFACFSYVTYRHIYLGEGLNEKAKVHQTCMSYG